jgi:uncharacterized protein
MQEGQMSDTFTDRKPFPQTRWALAWIIGYFFLQISCGLIALSIAFPELNGAGELVATLSDLSKSGPANLYGSASAGVITILMLALFLGRHGRVAAIGLDRWSQLSVGKTIGIGFLMLAAAAAATFIYSNYIVQNNELQAQTRQLIASIPHDWLNQTILFLTIAVFAAIVEEVLFRGLLQNGLKRRVGPAWAIVIAGLIFAAVHMQPMAFPILAILGMAFGYLYHVTGSLRVNIALHLVNNSAALLLG